jgi:hypothetical protein
MAEKGERRSPTSHRTPTQVRRQARGYNAEPKQVRNRTKNNQARRQLEKEGKVSKGDGKDVHHKKPLRSGGSNKRSNLQATSRSKNRAWRSEGKSGKK